MKMQQKRAESSNVVLPTPLDIYGKESWSSLVMHYVYARHHSFFVNGKKATKEVLPRKDAVAIDNG